MRACSGASLQNYNNELVKCLEDLREKRESLNKTVGGNHMTSTSVQ